MTFMYFQSIFLKRNDRSPKGEGDGRGIFSVITNQPLNKRRPPVRCGRVRAQNTLSVLQVSCEIKNKSISLSRLFGSRSLRFRKNNFGST